MSTELGGGRASSPGPPFSYHEEETAVWNKGQHFLGSLAETAESISAYLLGPGPGGVGSNRRCVPEDRPPVSQNLFFLV